MTIHIPNDINNITFNGNDLDELKVNGTTIWSRSSGGYTNPMYIESQQNGSTVSLSKTGNPSETYYTSSDNSSYHAYTYGTTVTLNLGERLYWYSSTQAVHSDNDYVKFTMTGRFKVAGNIQSLNNYSTSVGNQGYIWLFQNCSAIYDVSELELTATTVGRGGYGGMFKGCYNITTPPTISVTTFTGIYNCNQMFQNCSALTTAPVLPATTLGENCYNSMFKGCYSLTTIPANMLPATTLVDYCYGSMFQDCTALTTIPSNMLPATTLAGSCCYRMFRGCTSLATVTVLPATTLSAHCYEQMFQNCSSLTSVPSNMLPATTLAYGCYTGMFSGCIALTTAPVLPATTLASSCYQTMFNSCTSLSSITALFISTPNESNNTYYWLNNVSSTGTFTMNGLATWNPENYRGINGVPNGWTVNQENIYYDNPMYIESKQNGSTLTLSKTGSPSETYYISSDNVNDAYKAYTYGTTITLDEGERVYWYSPKLAVHSSSKYVQFVMTGDFKVAGNIQSLMNYSTSVGDYGFYKLFKDCSAISDVSDLKLTATTLGQSCYYGMFNNCTSLTTVPSNMLPETTLGAGCYSSMFRGCSSLTTAPELPATTLTSYCYTAMFSDCTSLTTAPELPATTLKEYCYNQMFYNCSSLTTAPELPATTLATNCYSEMFRGCTSLSSITALFTDAPSANNGTRYWVVKVSSTGTFTMNANATWNPENYRTDSGVPVGWTVTTVTPQ